MKKAIKLLLEIPAWVGASVFAEKIAIPQIKTTMGIQQKIKAPPQNYQYSKTTQKKYLTTQKTIQNNQYSYSTTEKKKPQKQPAKITKTIDLNLKYWNEWLNWGGDIHNKISKWLVKYIVDKYYKSTKALTAASYWTYFENKLLKLRYGNDDFKKRTFYDIINHYRIIFLGEK